MNDFFKTKECVRPFPFSKGSNGMGKEKKKTGKKKSSQNKKKKKKKIIVNGILFFFFDVFQKEKKNISGRTSFVLLPLAL